MVATSLINYSTSYTGCSGDLESGNAYIPEWDWNTASTYINYDYTRLNAAATYKLSYTYDSPMGNWTIPLRIHPSNALTDNEYVVIPSDYADYQYDYSYVYKPRVIAKEDMLQMRRSELRSNLVIHVKSRNEISKYPGEAEPERKALETLREIVTETEFRKYLRYGFVLVKGQSGKMYQVFKNKSHCKVWLNGKVVEEVCVRIKNKEIPLTDNVIAFKTMIETSEEGFKKLGNVYKMAI